MKVPIKIFITLNQIRRGADLTQTQWGEASGMAQSRIAELNQLAKGKKNYGVRFTADKAISLYSGLEKILGREAMRRKILDTVQAEPDPRIKLMMLLLTLNDETVSKVKDIVENISKEENE